MTILEQLIDIFRARPEFFLRLTIDHIWISALAIAFAVALGLALGIVANESTRFEPLIMGVVNTVYTLSLIHIPETTGPY